MFTRWWILTVSVLLSAVLAAQDRDHPGLVPLGDGKWGTAQEAANQGLIEYRGRWVPKKMERQLASWEQLDARMKGWGDSYTTKSSHFTIKTDVPRFIVETELKPFFDRLYETYVAVFQGQFKLTGKGANMKQVMIYHGYETYRQQTGCKRSTPGYIVGGSVMHVFYEDFDAGRFYNTCFHEGAHQFFGGMLPGAALPQWLTEGLATYFEGCTYSRVDKTIRVGFVPQDRLRFAKMQLAKAVQVDPVEMFMKLSQKSGLD